MILGYFNDSFCNDIKGSGFGMILFLASLGNISPALYEAAAQMELINGKLFLTSLFHC